jgi:hypothetical protein
LLQQREKGSEFSRADRGSSGCECGSDPAAASPVLPACVPKRYPSLREKLRRGNFSAVVASGALAGFSLSNFVLTAFLLLHYGDVYGGYRRALGIGSGYRKVGLEELVLGVWVRS